MSKWVLSELRYFPTERDPCNVTNATSLATLQLPAQRPLSCAIEVDSATNKILKTYRDGASQRIQDVRNASDRLWFLLLGKDFRQHGDFRNWNDIRTTHFDRICDTEEYVGVRVELKGRPVTFVSAYVPPQSHLDPKTIADICTRIKGEAVIAGDFNSHNETWGDKKTDARGRALQSTLDGLALRNKTSGEQTFVRPGVEGSAIDLTFITRGLHLTFRPEKDSWGSDYLPIIIGKPPKVPLKTCHLVDWKEYRGQLDKLIDSGAPLAPENIAEALKKATRMVQIPIKRQTRACTGST
ncbi:hypothetical protein HPB47_016413 [Ixodes persulcatus]|uniref:Uncharacterized protein n=1 Tax=Ixodes persulcatus TaxID=34615 RepID=A0AC60R371_IXOPE|nr:hypothetical protein HPB47_016413 [Ixodes persulcatus]